MAWEQYKNQSKRVGFKSMGEDIISIRIKSNSISFPTKITGNATKVEVFLDKKQKQIGFVFSNNTVNGFSLIKMTGTVNRKYIFSKGLSSVFQDDMGIREFSFTRKAMKEYNMWVINI